MIRYAVERAATHIKFAVDDTVILAFDNTTLPSLRLWPVPFYLILNTAVGGSWPGQPDAGTVFPTYHIIDSVTVSRKTAAARPTEE